MEEAKQEYVKRTQRDYPMPFKMAVVLEVERTGIGICAWLVNMGYKVRQQLPPG